MKICRAMAKQERHYSSRLGRARAEVSVASLLAELETARLLALKLGQASITRADEVIE